MVFLCLETCPERWMAWLVSLLYCSKQVSASALNTIYFMKKRTKFVCAFFFFTRFIWQTALSWLGLFRWIHQQRHFAELYSWKCLSPEEIVGKENPFFWSIFTFHKPRLSDCFLMPLLAQVFLRCACSCISTINSMTFINFSKWEYWPYKMPLLVGCIHSQ